MLDDDRIAQILRSGSVDLVSGALVVAANDAGGVDNISVVAFRGGITNDQERCRCWPADQQHRKTIEKR